MPFRDDPYHHKAKLEDLVEYYESSKADANKAHQRLRQARRLSDQRADAQVRADIRRAAGLFLWTLVLGGWGGGLLAWSQALLSRTSEPVVPAFDSYCAEEISYERTVCDATVDATFAEQRGICIESQREIQHALYAYQMRAQQMPAYFPLILSRGDPNVITETLPSGTVITYTRDFLRGDEPMDDCEARLHHVEDLAGRWYDIYVTTARHGSPSLGQRAWIENRMHMEVEVDDHRQDSR